MKKGIITNKKVDKTFEGVECLLLRTIVSTIKNDKVKTFVIRTERCNYVEKQRPVLTEDGSQKIDADGKRVFETYTDLEIINQKDQDVVREYSFAEINAFYEQIKPIIDTTKPYMEIENTAEQLALFEETKKDKAFGTLDEDWELIEL